VPAVGDRPDLELELGADERHASPGAGAAGEPPASALGTVSARSRDRSELVSAASLAAAPEASR
jgi:hypothetical protein